MSSSKLISVFFAFFSIGSINETFRILTSDAPDITASRASLIPIRLVITSLFIFLTLWFWKKAQKNQI